MAAYSPNDVVNAIVADVGQGNTKMGFAGEDYPRSYFRSVSKRFRATSLAQ
jgi:actin-related protein